MQHPLRRGRSKMMMMVIGNRRNRGWTSTRMSGGNQCKDATSIRGNLASFPYSLAALLLTFCQAVNIYENATSLAPTVPPIFPLPRVSISPRPCIWQIVIAKETESWRNQDTYLVSLICRSRCFWNIYMCVCMCVFHFDSQDGRTNFKLDPQKYNKTIAQRCQQSVCLSVVCQFSHRIASRRIPSHIGIFAPSGRRLYDYVASAPSRWLHLSHLRLGWVSDVGCQHGGRNSNEP